MAQYRDSEIEIVDGTCVTKEWPTTSQGVIEAFSDGITTVDKMLDYVDLELDWYIPSKYAIEFIVFIRLVLGEEPENNNPKAHYFLMDCIFNQDNVKPFYDARGIDFEELQDRVVVLCTREFAKSVMVVYLILFMAAKGEMPGFGKVLYGIYVSDSMRNNVETTMTTIAKVYSESKYLRNIFEDTRLIQTEVNFIRKPSTPKEIEIYHQHVIVEKQKPNTVPGRMKRTLTVTGLGAAALPLNTKLIGEHGTSTIGSVQIGDRVYGPDGKLARVTEKSKVFNNPMYRITLKDGRTLDVTDDHINSVVVKENPNNSRNIRYVDRNLTTKELLSMDLTFDRARTGRKTSESLLWVRNTDRLQFTKKDFPVDPYTLGLLLGDSSFRTDSMNNLHMIKEDITELKSCIPYEFGTQYSDKRSNVVCTNIKGISAGVKELGLTVVTCKDKFIPIQYLRGSERQRRSLLRGLMDSDGSIYKSGRMKFTSISPKLASGVTNLVRSLGGTAFETTRQNTVVKKDSTNRELTYIVELSIQDRVFNLARKYSRQKPNRKMDHRVPIVSIEPIPIVPTQCIAIDNDDRQYLAEDYFRTHNTGGRGSRDGLARPDFAIFDDMIPNEKDAESETVLDNIESTIESDILKALSGNGNFAIAFGTPYNKKDPIYRRIEEGSWLPVVFPRAKKFDETTTKENFVSVWPDRHTYKQCRKDYLVAKRAEDRGNKMPMRKLLQENYLRISNEEDRMISDRMIQWYRRTDLEKHISAYNIYITTDFTTTGSDGSDYSGIAAWAVGSNSDYFLLDLSLKKLELEDQYNEVFRMAKYYGNLSGRSVTVGVETDGQQKTHIFALKERMVMKNEWFIIGRGKGSKIDAEGINSRLEGGNKHWRFRMILPQWQNHKIWFPRELNDSPDMYEMMEELKYVTYNGFGCVSGDTLIGNTPMKYIQDSDTVKTYDGDKLLNSKAINPIMTGIVHTYTVTTEAGEMHLTADHKVLTLRGYVEAQELVSTDLIVGDIPSQKNDTVTSGQSVNQAISSPHKPLAGSVNGFIGIYMKQKMAIFLKGMKYIIQITISEITEALIWRYYFLLSIKLDMQKTQNIGMAEVIKTEQQNSKRTSVSWLNWRDKVNTSESVNYESSTKAINTESVPTVGSSSLLKSAIKMVRGFAQLYVSVSNEAKSVILSTKSLVVESALNVVVPSYKLVGIKYVVQKSAELNVISVPLKLELNNTPVENAELSSLHTEQIKLSTVEKSVKLLRENDWMSKDSAEDVEIALWQRLKRQSTAQIAASCQMLKSVEYRKLEIVYDFEVKGTHNYVTGFGAVIHNSLHDDGCDLISQLGAMDIMFPMRNRDESEFSPVQKRRQEDMWDTPSTTEKSAYNSYA